MLPIYRLNAMCPSRAAPTLVGASPRPSVMPSGPRGIPHAGVNPTARHASPFDLFMTRAEATALHGALRPRPPAGPPSARGRGAGPPGAWLRQRTELGLYIQAMRVTALPLYLGRVTGRLLHWLTRQKGVLFGSLALLDDLEHL